MNDTTHALAVRERYSLAEEMQISPGWHTRPAFELMQREARALMEADMLPEAYRGNFGNCMIVLDMATRSGRTPLQVAQNLIVINGRPSWTAQWMLDGFNRCGRFTPMRVKYNADHSAAKGYATELATGEIVEGPVITLDMAKKAGWLDRKGSLWQTIPEMMLFHRAVAWMAKQYAPEVALGLPSVDETRDSNVIDMVDTVTDFAEPETQGLQAVRDVLRSQPVVQQAAARAQVPPPGASAANVEPPTSLPPDPVPPPSQVKLIRKATPPRFNADAYAQKVRGCSELAVLELMHEEVLGMPDGANKDELLATIKQRASELMNSEGETDDDHPPLDHDQAQDDQA